MKQGLHRAALHLALIAMLVRAFLPTGWMPAHEGHPGSFLSICTMDGFVHISSQHPTGKPAPHEPSHSQEECPFAAAAHLAFTPDAPQLVLPALHAFVAAIDRTYAATVSARFSPQSPRAPPLSA